jgi:polysaccharide biosynthesis protein PslG
MSATRRPAVPAGYGDAMGRKGRRLRLLVTAATLALTCCACASGPGSGPSAATPKPKAVAYTKHARAPHAVLFGLSDPQLILERPRVQARQLARMRSIGIDAIRFDANWSWVQFGGPHSFDWSMLDREVRSARAAKMTVDLVIDGCPGWAAVRGAGKDPSPQPASAARFATWAADVARRYGPEGVSDFEIWNEPNDSKFWQPKVNPAFYSRMLADSYRAIKRVDRSAYVIAGGLAPVTSSGGSLSAIAFLRQLYAREPKPDFNAVADHPYSFPALPSTYEPWSAWSQMSETSPSLRSVMAGYHDSRAPIWITEFGAPSDGPSGVGPAGQAAELRQAITIAKKTSWIAAIFVYSWTDLGTKTWTNADWFGLLTYAGRAKQAYWAVARAIR